eukprot:m.276836 g.276836  ORF g.276836 m.276836 type:complete len:475 (+) comp19770_c0_seq26:121-1545(+)
MFRAPWHIGVIVVVLILSGSSQSKNTAQQKNEPISEVHSALFDTTASTFSVLDYGAKADGASNNAEAFEKAFEACRGSAALSKVVFFPGTRDTTSIYVAGPWNASCNDTVVVIPDNVVIQSINSTLNWPLGMDCPEPSQGLTTRQAAPFILVHKARNLSMIGGGMIDAHGSMWWEEHCGNWWCPPWAANVSAKHPYAWRPYMLRVAESSDVRVLNLTFKDPGFWCIVPTHSSEVEVAHVNITSGGEGPNTDGIEPMWTTNAHLHDLSIWNGDDCITVKSGSSNILIENLHCRGSHGITIGSVWYDDVRNITYRNVAMEHCGAGPRIKGRRQGNATISDITFENVVGSTLGTGIEIDMLYETPGSTAKNIGVGATRVEYRNVTGTSLGKLASLQCIDTRPCTGLSAIDVRLSSSINIAPVYTGHLQHQLQQREVFGNSWECKNVNFSMVLDVSPKPGSNCFISDAKLLDNTDVLH